MSPIEASKGVRLYQLTLYAIISVCENPPGFDADNSLLQAKNTVITPHVAWATQSARRWLINTTPANVRAFLNGKAGNVVNW